MTAGFRLLSHLTALRAFETAARRGSFLAAAEELGVTPGAVSRLVRQIEDGTGVQLFERLHRGLRLTQAGERLARATEPAFERLRGLDSVLKPSDQASPLVIAAPATFLLRWLIPRLGSLQAALGERQVATATWDAPFDPSLEIADIVVGVGLAPSRGKDSPLVRDLMPEHFALVVNPRQLEVGRPLAESLVRLPRLVPNTRPRIWSDWIAEGGVDLPHAGERRYERMFFVLQAAEAGLGVAIAPLELVHDGLQAGTLVAPLGAIRRPGTYHLLVSRRGASAASVTTALRWLRREAQIQIGSAPPLPPHDPQVVWEP